MTIAVPISDLLLSKGPFLWVVEQQCAFDSLKAKLTSAPMLKLAVFGKPFELCCDASVIGLGNEMSQQ